MITIFNNKSDVNNYSDNTNNNDNHNNHNNNNFDIRLTTQMCSQEKILQ